MAQMRGGSSSCHGENNPSFKRQFLSKHRQVAGISAYSNEIWKISLFYFSNEHAEPRHIHVESADNYAKFWLEPLDLAKSAGYKNIELREIESKNFDNTI